MFVVLTIDAFLSAMKSERLVQSSNWKWRTVPFVLVDVITKKFVPFVLGDVEVCQLRTLWNWSAAQIAGLNITTSYYLFSLFFCKTFGLLSLCSLDLWREDKHRHHTYYVFWPSMSARINSFLHSYVIHGRYWRKLSSLIALYLWFDCNEKHDHKRLLLRVDRRQAAFGSDREILWYGDWPKPSRQGLFDAHPKYAGCCAVHINNKRVATFVYTRVHYRILMDKSQKQALVDIAHILLSLDKAHICRYVPFSRIYVIAQV